MSTNNSVKTFGERSLVDGIHDAVLQGETIDVEPIIIDPSHFVNFILQNHEYFKGMSMVSSLEHMLERARAEITRQIKTAVKQKENKVYGDLARKYNLTLEQAQAVLSQAAAKVEAEKASAK